MNRILFAVALLAPSLLGQSSPGTVRTSGTCNPVVTGTTGAITIQCVGISGRKADEMIVLMNKLLAEHLDLKEVTTKLDSIGAELKDLNETVNPLATMPPEILKLFADSQSLQLSCTNLLTEWSARDSSHRTEWLQAQTTALPTGPERAGTAKEAVTTQEVAEYQKTLLPRVKALDARLKALNVQSPRTVSLDPPHSSYDATVPANELFNEVKRYETLQKRRGGTVDPTLHTEADALLAEARTFAQAWGAADRDAIAHSYTGYKGASLPVDTEEVQKYQSTLEPNLVSFRQRASPYVPDYKSSVDCAQVTSAGQLARVCSDIGRMLAQYQMQRQIDVLNKKAEERKQ
jgi:hypothetical protein